jgi:hypothetical protein
MGSGSSPPVLPIQHSALAMATSNYISKVAIVGVRDPILCPPSSVSPSADTDILAQAGGNVGRFMTEALLKTGNHTVTAITRPQSQNTFPPGVVVKNVDYSNPETLVEALRGQDALIITISGHAPIQETEEKLVKAAGEAGVPWM